MQSVENRNQRNIAIQGLYLATVGRYNAKMEDCQIKSEVLGMDMTKDGRYPAVLVRPVRLSSVLPDRFSKENDGIFFENVITRARYFSVKELEKRVYNESFAIGTILYCEALHEHNGESVVFNMQPVKCNVPFITRQEAEMIISHSDPNFVVSDRPVVVRKRVR